MFLFCVADLPGVLRRCGAGEGAVVDVPCAGCDRRRGARRAGESEAQGGPGGWEEEAAEGGGRGGAGARGRAGGHRGAAGGSGVAFAGRRRLHRAVRQVRSGGLICACRSMLIQLSHEIN